MAGDQLIHDLARTEKELAQRLEDARRSAEERIGRAEEKARLILDGAEEQMRQMTRGTGTRIESEVEKIHSEARSRARSEDEHIRSQAAPNIDRAVSFVLSRVLP